MGYAGGTTKNPTYYQLADHSETVQLDFDPSLVSFEELLALFWAAHNPAGPQYSRQYASVIFCHDEAQKTAAFKSKEQQEEALGATIKTSIIAFEKFHLAEDYHQKYFLQGAASINLEIRAYYDLFNDFINSTAAARLNGLLGGYLNPKLFEAEYNRYGLSDRALAELKRYLV